MTAKPAFSGNKRWEEKYPEVADELCRLAEEHGQQDPSFRSTVAFTRLTPAGTMAKILNRLGYRLRRVVKAKPKKNQRPAPSSPM